MGVIAEISARVKKEFYGYRKEKQLMFNFMDVFFCDVRLSRWLLWEALQSDLPL